MSLMVENSLTLLALFGLDLNSYSYIFNKITTSIPTEESRQLRRMDE